MDRYSGSILAVILSVIIIVIFCFSFLPKVEEMSERAKEYNKEILSILED